MRILKMGVPLFKLASCMYCWTFCQYLYCLNPPPPHSTGRRSRYAHGDLGFSLKLFQIAAEAYTATRFWNLTLPVRFHYASTTLPLRCYYNEDLAMLSLLWWRCSCDLSTTLAMELRFRCAFISFLYRIWNSDTLRLRPRRFYCISTMLLLRPCRFCYDSCHFDQNFEL